MEKDELAFMYFPDNYLGGSSALCQAGQAKAHAGGD